MRRLTRILRLTPSAQRCSRENGVERPKVDRSVLKNGVAATDSGSRPPGSLSERRRVRGYTMKKGDRAVSKERVRTRSDRYWRFLDSLHS
jgi:hypothetical protein